MLTKEGLFFGRAEETSSEAPVLDKIILRNVARIDNRNFEVSKHVRSKSHLDPDTLDLFGGIHAMAGGQEKPGKDSLGKDKSSAPGGDDRANVIALTTLETSDHCSRKYLLRCDSPERREEWKRALESYVERETKRAVQGDLLRHYQGLSRAVFTNVWLRWFFALCILSSFIIDALETQYLPLGRTDDALGLAFFYLELAFTILFTVELAWNMFSYWFWDFFGDSWSLFDFAVVMTSIASVGTSANVKSVRMVRVLRALRVVSQFKSLRKIVRALTQGVQPVASAMFVALIAISVFAILGVNFFAERAPETFGDFGRAMWTLLITATLENWTEHAEELMGGVRGQLDSGVIAYFVVYVILVSYVLTSIVIAVLLENFSEASRAEEELEMWEAEQRQAAEGIGFGSNTRKFGGIGSPLDPLLAELVHIDTLHQLNLQLSTLFQLLDVDESGELSFDEMQLGLQAFELRPRIQMSAEDFRQITLDGTLLNAEGCLTSELFVEMMCLQMRDYIGRQMCKQSNLPQNSRAVSSLFAGVNFMMMMSLKADSSLKPDYGPPTPTVAWKGTDNDSHRSSKQDGGGIVKVVADCCAQDDAQEVARASGTAEDGGFGRRGQIREHAREVARTSEPADSATRPCNQLAEVVMPTGVGQLEALMLQVQSVTESLERKMDRAAAEQSRQQADFEARMTVQLERIHQRLTSIERAASLPTSAPPDAVARSSPSLSRVRDGNRIIIGGERQMSDAGVGGVLPEQMLRDAHSAGQASVEGGSGAGEGKPAMTTIFGVSGLEHSSHGPVQRFAPVDGNETAGSGGEQKDVGPAAALRRYNNVVQQGALRSQSGGEIGGQGARSPVDLHWMQGNGVSSAHPHPVHRDSPLLQARRQTLGSLTPSAKGEGDCLRLYI